MIGAIGLRVDKLHLKLNYMVRHNYRTPLVFIV